MRRSTTWCAWAALALAPALWPAVAAPAAHAQAAAVCAPAPAPAPGPDVDSTRYLETGTNRIGLIDLFLQYANGAPVAFYECIDGRARTLGTVTQPGAVLTATTVPWSCARQTREFRGTLTLPDGRFVRAGATSLTPSCAHRMRLTAPRRLRVGATAAVRVSDRWGVGGITARLCTTSPAGRRSCRRLAFAPSVAHRSLRVRAASRGRWKLDLQVRGFHVRATVAAGVKAATAKPRPSLLTTGDSTMNGVSGALSDELPEYDTHADVRPGRELSTIDWAPIARAQVATGHPSVVVVSIGAAEGFPMTTPEGAAYDCCDAPWLAEYTRRLRQLMRIYRQGGRARVYYETIALPREDARAAIIAACNRAIVDAAKGLEGVSVLRMDQLFTPRGYQETIRDRGRDVAVRERDGIHLNASGTAIEARETAAAIRADERLRDARGAPSEE
jgi:lysophospholipase L1-like esterase